MRKIFIVTLLLLTTGCFNYQEISNMEVVTSFGLDIEDHELNTTIKVINVVDPMFPPETVSYHATGPSISANLSYLQNQLEKPLYFGHLTKLVIGEDLAEDGIFPHLEFFLKRPGLHQNFPLLIAYKDQAVDVLDQDTTEDEEELDNTLQQIMESFTRSQILNDANLEIIINRIKTPGIEATVPTVRISESLLDGAVDLEKNSVAVFRSDQLVGYLTEEAALGLRLIKDQNQNLNIPLVCKGQNINLDVRRSRVRINQVGNNYQLKLHVTGSLDKPCAGNKLNRQLEAIINQTIKESQELGSDIIGIGRYAHIFHRRNLDNWHQIYRELNIELVVNTRITRARSAFIGGF